MIMITTIISYPPIVKRKKTLKEKRAERAELGLCLGCGGERPCGRCAQRSRKARDKCAS